MRSSEQVALDGRIRDLENALAAETRRLHALIDLNRTLATTLDLERLLLLLLDKLCELLDAERATLYLVSDEGDELCSQITMGGVVEPIRLRMGEGIAGWVAETRSTVNIPDAYADSRFQKEVDQRSGFRTRSMLCMPMPDHHGRVIGVVQVLNKRERPFNSDDEAMLAAVASHSGIAIENSKLYQSVRTKNDALIAAEGELRRKVRDLDLLLEIEREVSAATHVDDLLDRLLVRAIQLANATAGAILLRSSPTGELYFRSAIGGAGEAVKRFKLPEGHGIVGWVSQHLEPQIVNEPSDDPRHEWNIASEVGFYPRNLLAVPLVMVGDDGETQESLGAIEVLDRRPRPSEDAHAGFDAADMKLLQLIAGHASRAVALARAKEERARQDRLAAVGQLLSGVLHDLRTPMTVISGYAQLMVTTEDEATRGRMAEAIRKQFDLMNAMTREVLAFARGESNLLVRKVFMQKFVDEVKQQLERELAGKNVKLEIDARYLGVAYFDELKFFRVIHNIARNAVQAMEGGGTFRITIDNRGGDLCMDFADTGRGIPTEMEGRLFQPFATAGKAEGTGLGLAMVKKIVDEHRGRVTYSSERGKGTTFHIALPLLRSTQQLTALQLP